MNKKGYLHPFGVVTGVVLTFLIVVPMSMILATLYINNGTIIINRPYHTEYQTAQNQLEECKESKIPSCAPCVCKQGSIGILWSIIGAIFGISGYLMYFYTLNKIDKLKDKSKKKKT